jgi:hypothetical protein
LKRIAGTIIGLPVRLDEDALLFLLDRFKALKEKEFLSDVLTTIY